MHEQGKDGLRRERGGIESEWVSEWVKCVSEWERLNSYTAYTYPRHKHARSHNVASCDLLPPREPRLKAPPPPPQPPPLIRSFTVFKSSYLRPRGFCTPLLKTLAPWGTGYTHSFWSRTMGALSADMLMLLQEPVTTAYKYCTLITCLCTGE